MRPSGFIKPCLPSKVSRPPSGALWVHEIKHDGYRLMVRRDGLRIRCFTRNGNDWADRFPAIVEAAARLKAQSFLIDGEAVIVRDDGTPDFRALRSRRRGHEAVLFAFDLIGHDGDDLCDLPLIERKRRLTRLIGKAQRRAIRFVEHVTGDGPTVFEHVCRMGLEGIVSKRTDAPYRSGPSRTWLKSKNPASEAVRRERERISMTARSTNAPFKGRIQKRKTNHLQIITFGLQLSAPRNMDAQMDCAEMGRLLMIAALAAPAPMDAY